MCSVFIVKLLFPFAKRIDLVTFSTLRIFEKKKQNYQNWRQTRGLQVFHVPNMTVEDRQGTRGNDKIIQMHNPQRVHLFETPMDVKHVILRAARRMQIWMTNRFNFQRHSFLYKDTADTIDCPVDECL